MSARSIAEEYMFNTYDRCNSIVLSRGEGVWLWDDSGNKYVDFVSGLAVCALGYNLPIISEVIAKQSQKLIHASNLYYTEPQSNLANLLINHSFADKVFFCNSGAEANEAAIKIARKYSTERYGIKRQWIISMKKSFHGRTIATLSATGHKKEKTGYEPLLPGFKFVDYNDLNSLENAVDDTICAVLIEPIQGQGGVVCPDQGYLENVRKICYKNKLLLIFDEIQVGLGRTGKLFAYENFGITPDIMTLAKSLANGLPIGAMLSTNEVASAFTPGSHASTFGGSPLVTAVSCEVLNYMLNNNIISYCKNIGAYFQDKLCDLKRKYAIIKEVRGYGLIIGMELQVEGHKIVDKCRNEGFLINCVQGNILRFLPPLIITASEIDSLIAVLDKLFYDLI